MGSAGVWLLSLSLVATAVSAAVAAHARQTAGSSLDLASEYKRIADRVIHDAEHVAALEDDHGADVRTITMDVTLVNSTSDARSHALKATIRGLDGAGRAVRFDAYVHFLVFARACPSDADPSKAEFPFDWPVIPEMFTERPARENATTVTIDLGGASPASAYCLTADFVIHAAGQRFLVVGEPVRML